MWVWNALGLLVGILTLIGVYYTKKQVDLLREDSREKKLWSTKHAEAVSLVIKTHNWITMNGAQTIAYSHVFNDPAIRQWVETYIVHMDWPRSTMTPRVLEADQFALPIVQDTIKNAIETVQRFKRDHPADAAKLNL